jgi:hypothetical protein
VFGSVASGQLPFFENGEETFISRHSEGELLGCGIGRGIPVEYDPELDIPVEHIPKLSEFFWTISIHDTSRQKLEGELPLTEVYKLDLEVVKAYGKAARGVYVGTLYMQHLIEASWRGDQYMLVRTWSGMERCLMPLLSLTMA